MGIFSKIWAYISGALFLIVIVQGALIYNYKNEIKAKAADILIGEINVASLEDAIIKYNLIVEKDKIDTEAKNKAYLDSQKPEVIIKYIEKYLPQKDENATECENINDVLSNVRNLGL